MPRQVDHDQRRRQIAEGVWSVMADDGIDAVSLRRVAAAAGVSMGRVQYYFGSKDALVLHACEAMAEMAAEHVGASATDDGWEAAVPAGDVRELLRDVLSVGISGNDAARRAAGVWFAFVTKAAVWPELATAVARQHDGAHDVVERLLVRAGQLDLLAPWVDPSREAVALMALSDGIVVRVLVGSLDPSAARATIEANLDATLRRPGRRHQVS